MMSAIWALVVLAGKDYTPMTGSGAVTGESDLLVVALTLPLAFTGAGRWSLDAMRTGGRP
jgi:putative oxidoreductase